MSAAASPWYAAGLRFECVRCGACCTGAPGVVRVEDDEIAPLAAALGMSGDEVVRELLRCDGRALRLYEWPNGDCVLYDPGSRGCRVYQARPRQCRRWPFWERVLRTPEDWQRTSLECPGCGRGPLVARDAIERWGT